MGKKGWIAKIECKPLRAVWQVVVEDYLPFADKAQIGVYLYKTSTKIGNNSE